MPGVAAVLACNREMTKNALKINKFALELTLIMLNKQ